MRVSSNWFECIAICSDNTNGSVFWCFMDKVLSNLKLKYQEYFAKIIILWDGARYHLVNEMDKLLKSEEIMMVVTIPYTPEFSFVELFINNIKNRFRAKLRKGR